MKTITRNQLYNDVWSRPATKVADALGITSTALKKICKIMDVPTPARGHWTRIRHGQEVRRIPLRPARKDTRLEYQIHEGRPSGWILGQGGGRGERFYPDVPIAKDCDNLHPLVLATRAHLNRSWRKGGKAPAKERSRLDARITKGVLERSLLFLDALVRGVESAGFRLISDCDLDEPCPRGDAHLGYGQGQTSPCCWVDYKGTRVEFWLAEETVRVDVPRQKGGWGFRDWKDEPTGRLCLSIDTDYGYSGRRNWRDGKVQRVEQFLGQIVVAIQDIGEHKHRRRLEREERERWWRARESTRKGLQRQREQEERVTELLLELHLRHERAKRLREFLEICRSAIAEELGMIPEANSDLGLWLRWVEARADILDPMQQVRKPWELADIGELMGCGEGGGGPTD